MTLEDVNEHSPLLASRVAAETSDGIDQVATKLFDEIAKTRQAGVKTHRKRMLAIQKSRESFGSDIIFSPKEVTDLLGVRMATLRTWHDRRWGATTGSWPNVSYAVHNLLIIAALHHWSINRLKLSDGIAGRLHYAIRAARVPFVAICITGDIPWVRTADPDGLLEALTGAPAALIYITLKTS